jgi:regulatory protein
MRRKLVPPEVADAVLDRFEEVGLVDDRAYAEGWVRSRSASRGLASRALARELSAKGVDREIVDDAVALITPEAEQAGATKLVRSKLPALARADPPTRMRRLAGLLARKGYSPEVAYAVIRRELAADDDDAPY